MGIDPEAGAENVGTDEAFPVEPWDGGIKPVAITLLPELGCQQTRINGQLQTLATGRFEVGHALHELILLAVSFLF